MSPLPVAHWTPFKRVQVETHTISETDLVELQVILDRSPDRPWTRLFTEAVAARRRNARHRPTFLGRYILLQPQQARVREDVIIIELAIDEANERYEREVLAVRHDDTIRL